MHCLLTANSCPDENSFAARAFCFLPARPFTHGCMLLRPGRFASASTQRRAVVRMSTAQGERGDGTGKGKLDQLEKQKKALLASLAALELQQADLSLQLEAGASTETADKGDMDIAAMIDRAAKAKEQDGLYNKNAQRRPVDPLHSEQLCKHSNRC